MYRNWFVQKLNDAHAYLRAAIRINPLTPNDPLQNEKQNDLYCSPNTVRMIKSRRMRWAGHVARMGVERGVYRVLVGKPEGKETEGV